MVIFFDDFTPKKYMIDTLVSIPSLLTTITCTLQKCPFLCVFKSDTFELFA